MMGCDGYGNSVATIELNGSDIPHIDFGSLSQRSSPRHRNTGIDPRRPERYYSCRKVVLDR